MDSSPGLFFRFLKNVAACFGAMAALFSLFSRPAGAQQAPPPDALPYATFSGPQGQSEVPFDTDSGMIYVHALINNKPARLLLDSLWGTDALTVDAARRLGVIGATPQSGPTTYEGATISRLRFGNLELRDDAVVVSPSLGMPIDGLIGYNTLSKAVVRINWKTKRLTFIDPARFVPPPVSQNQFVLPLTIARDHGASVAVELGGISANLQVDTGHWAAVLLEPNFTAKNALAEKWANRLGTAGSATQRTASLLSLQMGSCTVFPLTVELPAPVPPTPFPPLVDGRIGMGVLKHFAVTLDYPHRKLYLDSDVPPVSESDTARRAEIKKFGFPADPEKTLPPEAASACEAIETFQKRFKDYALWDANGAMYDTLCTPDFSVVIRPFGPVMKTIPRDRFLADVREGCFFTPELLAQAVERTRARLDPQTVLLEDTPTPDASDWSYWRAPRYETKGDTIVLTVSPALFNFDSPGTSGHKKPDSEMRMTLLETFVQTSDGLRLKRLEIVGYAVKSKGVAVPSAFLKNGDLGLGLD